jgi:hypothetical protein
MLKVDKSVIVPGGLIAWALCNDLIHSTQKSLYIKWTTGWVNNLLWKLVLLATELQINLGEMDVSGMLSVVLQDEVKWSNSK